MGGARRDVAGAGVAIADATVTLTLVSAVGAADTVKVRYTQPSVNPLRDAAGNEVETFADQAVVNETPDTTAPEFESATVDEQVLKVVFDEELDTGSVPAPGDFHVTVDGARRDVAGAGVAIADATVTLTLVSAVSDAQKTVKVRYTRPSVNPLRDAAGNAVETFADQAVTNETLLPSVTGVALVSTPTADTNGDDANDTYKVGDEVRARVTFDQPVDVVGSPVLKLRLAGDSGEKDMTFDDGGSVTGTTTLEFTWEVAAGDASTQGIGFGANGLTLGEGVAIRMAGTEVDADLDFDAVAHDAGHKVDGVRPKLRTGASTPIRLVSISGADGTYVIGDDVSVEVGFTEAVTVTTAGDPVSGPRLKLRFASETRWAVYLSGSGTSNLVFRYAVTEGDEVPDQIGWEQDGLDLDGGTIVDAAGNEPASAGLKYNSGTFGSSKVDGVRPAVTRAIVDGDTIALTWSEALDAGSKPVAADFEVTVAGSPVSLANGDPVSIAGRVLTLTLASAVSPGEEVVRVTWTGDARRLIRDVPGNGAASPVTWTVTNDTSRQPPTFDAGETATFAIEENAAAGTAVGTLAVTSPGGEPAFSLDSAGADHESFAIDRAGRITVAPGAALDYETKSSYSIVVSVTDGVNAAGNPQPPGMETPDDTIEVTITVTNIDPPDVPRVEPFLDDAGKWRIGDGLDGAIYLRWKRPAGTAPVTGYRVHWWRRDDYAGTVTHRDVAALAVGSALQDYTITGLTNDVVYGAALSAVNSEGRSPLSLPGTDDAYFVTPTAGEGLHASRTPRFLRVSAEAAGSLRVRWDAPSNIANQLDGYEIAWTSSTSFVGAPSARVSANARSHTMTGLVGGQVYRLRVSTVYRRNSGSEGVHTAPAFVSGTALSGPSAVTDFEVTAHDGRLRLRWAPPASDGGLPLARYEVRWGAPGETPAGEADVGLAETYAVTGLTNGETYEVGVRAVNSGTDPNPGGTARSFEGALAVATATPTAAPAAPVSADVVKETMEDTELAFAASDFPFTGAGAALAAVTVVTLPAAAHGTLYFGNPRRAVSAGERFVAGNLDALVFAPASGYVGTASFRFRVEDSRGAESGANTVFVRVLDAPAEPGRSVLGVSLVSDPGADATYAAGDTIRVRATFTGPITLSAGADRPSVKLELVNGAASVERTATYAGGDGTSSLELTYTVAAGDEAPDGVGIVANSLGGIEATSTASAADLTHAAVAADTGHKVDGVAPAVTGAPALVSAPSAGDTYGRGESVDVALTFSEPVAVNGAPRLAVRMGAETRQAVYRAGNGTATLTFRYTLVVADADADGISIPAGTLALAGGAITDLPGNAAALAHTALAAQPGHKVKGNSAPVAHAGGDLAVVPGAKVTLDGSGSTDADGDVLAWAWTQTGGTTVTLDNAAVARPGSPRRRRPTMRSWSSRSR